MRIVGGEWRGRALRAPEGRDTRPTTDKVRESIASIVTSAAGGSLEGASVLDAFAGSGALAFEMLSRGAARATLVEQGPRALACVRANAQVLGAGRERALVLRGDAFALARRGRVAGAPFDLVLLDPPYATPAASLSELVGQLDAAGALAAGALVMYERASDAPGMAPAGFELMSTHRYGSTSVDVLGRVQASTPEAADAADGQDGEEGGAR